LRENRWKKNKDKPQIPCKYRDFRFVLIITYGHSYAVAAIESGDDIKTVQGSLEHATASFTMDVYGHVSQKMKQQSAGRMEGHIQQLYGKKA